MFLDQAREGIVPWLEWLRDEVNGEDVESLPQREVYTEGILRVLDRYQPNLVSRLMQEVIPDLVDVMASRMDLPQSSPVYDELLKSSLDSLYRIREFKEREDLLQILMELELLSEFAGAVEFDPIRPIAAIFITQAKWFTPLLSYVQSVLGSLRLDSFVTDHASLGPIIPIFSLFHESMPSRTDLWYRSIK